ncbi:hypothetical protein TRFO_43096 [Tritrichomonas foetus]|uniref:Uncharacterized protein n=1 Tax=Tritrichomonas foetus TaxID=1144522 RepID=A0A1J4KSS0_9EUKA|nr:hypothetical protein TRFO_43096 [Tritrichomonas foetus]|eukprot:OHT14337.1 hypothetical protein TRFO_43096 [Tritrichomonas foetus]
MDLINFEIVYFYEKSKELILMENNFDDNSPLSIIKRNMINMPQNIFEYHHIDDYEEEEDFEEEFQNVNHNMNQRRTN